MTPLKSSAEPGFACSSTTVGPVPYSTHVTVPAEVGRLPTLVPGVSLPRGVASGTGVMPETLAMTDRSVNNSHARFGVRLPNLDPGLGEQAAKVTDLPGVLCQVVDHGDQPDSGRDGRIPSVVDDAFEVRQPERIDNARSHLLGGAVIAEQKLWLLKSWRPRKSTRS